MKKIFLIMFALICFGATANAQSCKISGAGDGSTVMVTQDYQEGNKIVVNLENDSETTCANVTVDVEVTYGANTVKTYTGRGKSCPNSTCRIEISFPEKSGQLDMRKYKIKSVSGTKCSSI